MPKKKLTNKMLKQSLGLLPKITQPPQVQVNIDAQANTAIQQTANLLAEYEHLFKEPAETINLPANDPAKQVDTAKTNAETSRVPTA